MRIIAGTWRSRRIKAPEGRSTRPTLDKVREAVFSSLGGMFAEGRFLDLYAGSGANGLEALSRGMDEAVFVDSSSAACRTIHENIETLGCKECTGVIRKKVMSALEDLRDEGKKFSVVYMDPPYAKEENEKVLKALFAYNLIEEGGRVLIESAREDTFSPQVGDLIAYKEAVYGITRITYYRKKEGEV